MPDEDRPAAPPPAAPPRPISTWPLSRGNPTFQWEWEQELVPAADLAAHLNRQDALGWGPRWILDAGRPAEFLVVCSRPRRAPER